MRVEGEYEVRVKCELASRSLRGFESCYSPPVISHS